VSGSVQDGLRRLTMDLAQGGVDDPAREARLILAHVLDVAPGRMTMLAPEPLQAGDLAAAAGLAQRRAAGEPMAHLLGYREFYGRRFAVDARVLDPRPETETLVERALGVAFSRVLDLGTGSGCILLSLLAERPDATGVGVDLSQDALEVARRNAARLDLSARCEFLVSDWFAAVRGTFDLIVSNPPYIAADEMAGLARELQYEPRMALTDEGCGLSAYRAIVAEAGACLVEGGRLIVEIGWRQGADVANLMRAGGFAEVCVRPDLDGRDRVVEAVWPG